MQVPAKSQNPPTAESTEQQSANQEAATKESHRGDAESAEKENDQCICHLTENPCRRIFGLSSTDLCLSVFVFGFTLYVPGSASFLATFEGVRHLYGGMCG